MKTVPKNVQDAFDIVCDYLNDNHPSLCYFVDLNHPSLNADGIDNHLSIHSVREGIIIVSSKEYDELYPSYMEVKNHES
jgi:hypothetical protein